MKTRPTTIVAAVLASISMGVGAPAAGVPPSGGTIAIEARTVGGNADPAISVFVEAAKDAFTARGFTVFADPGHAASVVELLLSRSDVGTGLARAPGERRVEAIGTGVAIPLSTGASQLVPLRRTRLEMRIHRRGETGAVWDGIAVTVREAGPRQGRDAMVAADLSDALLRSYPAQPKGVIGVP